MTLSLQIDIVSDVSCPWCAIGLYSLEKALDAMADRVSAELHFQPFELNPRMPPGGEDVVEHLTRKYGSTREQQAQIEETIRARGAAVGFAFQWDRRTRIYNTFDAHRLLHWAGLSDTGPAGRQLALEKALFEAYFSHGEAPESHDVLLRLAGRVGLDADRARTILAGDEFADAVRAREQLYLKAGIRSVPAVIINDHYLISGGQTAQAFEQALETVIAEQAAEDR